MKDFKHVIAQPRKVALYANLTLTDYYSVREVLYVDYDERYTPLPNGQLREYPTEGAVRISEPVEIQFTAISNDEIVAKAVESLNQEERTAIEELNKKVASIRERKNQLLALTHQPEVIP